METPVTRVGNVRMKRGGMTLQVTVRFPDPCAHAAQPVNCLSTMSAGDRKLVFCGDKLGRFWTQGIWAELRVGRDAAVERVSERLVFPSPSQLLGFWHLGITREFLSGETCQSKGKGQ